MRPVASTALVDRCGRTARSRQSGQASIEYIFIAMSVVIALVAISLAGKEHCVESFGGDLGTNGCDSLHSAVGTALTRTVEEVTFLINLPF